MPGSVPSLLHEHEVAGGLDWKGHLHFFCLWAQGCRVEGLTSRCMGRSNYLDPKSMQNNGLYGYFGWFRAIILHTFGV